MFPEEENVDCSQGEDYLRAVCTVEREVNDGVVKYQCLRYFITEVHSLVCDPRTYMNVGL